MPTAELPRPANVCVVAMASVASPTAVMKNQTAVTKSLIEVARNPIAIPNVVPILMEKAAASPTAVATTRSPHAKNKVRVATSLPTTVRTVNTKKTTGCNFSVDNS